MPTRLHHTDKHHRTFTSPAYVLKVNLAVDPPVEVSALPLDVNNGENQIQAAVMSADGAFGFWGTRTAPGRVVKVDLATNTRVSALVLDPGEDNVHCGAVYGQHGFFGYVWWELGSYDIHP